MRQNIKVSIIIVNYNTLRVTSNCIDSIVKHTSDVCYEIIVVDNASKDGSVEVLRKDSRIRLIESAENLGFGKANNLAYEQAKGEYIFLLNSDTLLLNNAVKEFADALDMMPSDVACLGTVLLAKDGVTPNHSFGQFPTIKSLCVAMQILYLRRNKVQNPTTHNSYPRSVEYITGADLFIRRTVIEKMGLFSPDFFMYFEETDMQYRYREAGYKSVVITSPQIIHLECASTGGGTSFHSLQKIEMYFKSMLLYYGKRYNGIKYLIARLLIAGYIPTLLSRKLSLKENLKIISLLLS